MENYRPVRPARPAAAYIGGKKRLAEILVERIERVPHKTYAEPFIGMGGVFLRRRWAPPCEVINDISNDVVTFFRILQRHYPQFMETLKFQIASRSEFERLMVADPSTLTDLERAARFLYLQRLAFGGKVAGRSFGVSPGTAARFDVTRLAPILEAIHERIAGVVVERLHWRDLVDRYDSAETLFFLDPPYFGSEADYGVGVFARGEFAQLAERLGQINGRFLLTVNDVPEMREAFGRFTVEALQTRYTIAGGEWSEVSEILVSGPGADVIAPRRDLLSL